MPAERTRAARLLGGELSRLRTAAGLSLRELGTKGVPPGTRPAIAHARVKRVEGGWAVPRPEEVAHWLNVTDADQATRVKVRDLLGEVQAQHQAWGSLLNDSPEHTLQAIAAAREEAAQRVDVFTHQWLPGMLQPEPYAHALFGMLQEEGFPIDVERSTEQRMRRQGLFREANCPPFRFLLTRRALAWNPPGTPAEDHSVTASSAAELDVVQARVLEDTAAPAAGWSSFTVYDGPEPLVSMELEHRSLQVFDEADVDRYRRRFEAMWAAAAPVAASN